MKSTRGPNKTTVEPFREAEKRQQERALRENIAELIDDLYIAYMATGRSSEEYIRTQFYENHLYQAINVDVFTLEERVGGLKLINLFLNRLIAHYQALAAEEMEKKDRVLPKER